MLLSFSVKNHLSFCDQVQFSLLGSTSDKTHKENISCGKQPVVKSALIYGPNASGKSNFLKALQNFSNFACRSAGAHENAGTPFKAFLLDAQAAQSPSEFEIIFSLEGSRYRYGFSADHKTVHDEWLFVAGKGKERFVFERTLENNTHSYEFGPSGRAFERLIKEARVRKNALLLSVGSQLNIPDAKSIVGFLSKIVSFHEEEGISHDNLMALSAIVKFADLGIEGIGVDSFDAEEDFRKVKRFNLQGTPVNGRIDFAQALREMKLYSFKYECRDGSIVDMYERDQSDGTLHFIGIINKIISLYRTGGVLLVDEIERSLHPFLCEALFTIVHSLPGNRIQVICTTHSTEIINADIFRRDQIWIAEKENFGKSTLIGIDEYHIRNTAKLGKQYLEGRFKGIPILNPKFFAEFMAIISAMDNETDNAEA